jgi:hypothetical protein
MGEVINLDLFRAPWKEVLSTDDCNGGPSTLQVYVNQRTGQVEVVQMNDDYEAIRTTLSASDVSYLAEVLSKLRMNKGA